jgi:ubiquinone/menaquinone biosynthesis C-methylase UbiE
MGETSKCRARVLKYLKGKGLDIGCGDDKICPDAVGIDRRKLNGVTMLWDDLYNLPFSDESWDYVFSSHCLEDLKDKKRALREWLRVLKTGKYLVLYLPHKDYYPNVGHPLANKAHYEDIDVSMIVKIINNIQKETGMVLNIISTEVYTPPEGIYNYENRHLIEYSFEIIVKKTAKENVLTR